MTKTDMLNSVRNYLTNFGAVNEKILQAMDKVDRKYFFNNSESVYVDTAQSIGCGQTISQPSTVARMLDLLELKTGDEVLEIGGGSGWNAALIAYLIKPGKLISLERVKELAEQAKENLVQAKIKNVKIENKDFRNIKEKFDKIIFTAGILAEDEAVIEKFAQKNLKDQGRLICPLRSGPLIKIIKNKNKIEKSYTHENYVFVPLILD